MEKINMPVISPVQYDAVDSGFIRKTIKWLTYTRRWEMMEDWYFTMQDGTTVLIPKGFIFDGASVPKIMRSLLSPTGVLFLAGIIHDYAYKYNKLISADFDIHGRRTLTDYHPNAGKLFWDGVFCDVAKQTNKLKVIDSASYYMLACFGFFAWNGHRRKEKVKH